VKIKGWLQQVSQERMLFGWTWAVHVVVVSHVDQQECVVSSTWVRDRKAVTNNVHCIVEDHRGLRTSLTCSACAIQVVSGPVAGEHGQRNTLLVKNFTALRMADVSSHRIYNSHVFFNNSDPQINIEVELDICATSSSCIEPPPAPIALHQRSALRGSMSHHFLIMSWYYIGYQRVGVSLGGVTMDNFAHELHEY
jgi:hypothetical protein